MGKASVRRGVRVYFNGERIMGRCQHCATELDLTALVQELKTWGRHDCPTPLYQAWKILVLGTSEYFDVEERQEDMEHRILAAAVKTVAAAA